MATYVGWDNREYEDAEMDSMTAEADEKQYSFGLWMEDADHVRDYLEVKEPISLAEAQDWLTQTAENMRRAYFAVKVTSGSSWRIDQGKTRIGADINEYDVDPPGI